MSVPPIVTCSTSRTRWKTVRYAHETKFAVGLLSCVDSAGEGRVRLDCVCACVSQVRNWADMDHLWRYTFDEKMHVNCADHKVWLNPMPWLRIWIR